MNKKSLISSAISVISYIAIQAQAGNVARSGDWKLDINTVNGVNQCVAYTDGSRDGLNLNVALVMNQNSGQPVEIIMWGKTSNAVSAGLTGGPRADATIQLGTLNAAPKTLSYWALARPTADLLAVMKASDKMKFGNQAGTVKPVPFSLDGFTGILAELEKRCNGSQSVTKAGFEAAFFKGIPLLVSDSQLDVSRVTSLRSLFFQAFKNYSDIEATRKELAQLRTKYGSDLDRAEALDNHIKDLKARLIPGTQKDIADTQKLISDSQVELQSVTGSIPGLDAAIPPLQADYTQKKSILDQVAPEHDRLDGLVDDASANLNRAQRDLSDVQSDLSNNRSQQSKLDSRARSLSSEIQRRQSDRFGLQNDLRNAQSDLDRFDFNFEYNQRLNSTGRYQTAKRDVDQYRRELAQAHADVDRLRADRDTIGRALQQCQATPGADCSALQAQMNSANDALRVAKDAERSASSRLSSAESEVQRLERNAQDETRRVQNQLIDRRNRAQMELDQLDNDLRNMQTERDNILNFQLPNLRREQVDLERRQSQLQSDIPRLQSSLRRAQSDLANYDAGSGYSGKKSASDQAFSRLRSAQNAAQAAKDRKARLERTIAEAKAELSDLQKQLASQQQDLAKSQNDLVALQPILSKYQAEKAPIEQKLTNQQGVFANTQAQYLRTLPAAVNP